MNPTRYKKMAIVFGVGFMLSSIGCAVLAYWLIDRSITLAYVTAGQDATDISLIRVKALLEAEWHGMPEEELMKKLEAEKNRRPEDNILLKKDAKESVIWFDDVRFEIEDEKVKRIVY